MSNKSHPPRAAWGVMFPLGFMLVPAWLKPVSIEITTNRKRLFTDEIGDTNNRYAKPNFRKSSYATT